jgi:ketosteroid isomerase-like protein
MNSIKESTPRQVAESYWRVESERDIEKVGQHYHVDAVFMPPGEHLVGWHNIKKWYEDSFRRFPRLHVEITHEISQGSEAAFEWRAVLTDVAGVRHALIGVNIVRVDNGKYREVRAYFDPASLTES